MKSKSSASLQYQNFEVFLSHFTVIIEKIILLVSIKSLKSPSSAVVGFRLNYSLINVISFSVNEHSADGKWITGMTLECFVRVDIE